MQTFLVIYLCLRGIHVKDLESCHKPKSLSGAACASSALLACLALFLLTYCLYLSFFFYSQPQFTYYTYFFVYNSGCQSPNLTSLFLFCEFFPLLLLLTNQHPGFLKGLFLSKASGKGAQCQSSQLWKGKWGHVAQNMIG